MESQYESESLSVDIVGGPSNLLGEIFGNTRLIGFNDADDTSHSLNANQTYKLKVTGITRALDVKHGAVTITYANGNLVSAVPEPESYAMLLAGLGLMGTVALRRKKST